MFRRDAAAMLRALASAIADEVGRDELYLAAALVLIAAGFWDFWRPGAYLVPGLVLLWVALPCRATFIAHTVAPPVTRKAERT